MSKHSDAAGGTPENVDPELEHDQLAEEADAQLRAEAGLLHEPTLSAESFGTSIQG